MASYKIENTDALNAILTIDIEKADYQQAIDKELKKYRSQANLKGFRKGKAPMNLIRKMYGKGLKGQEINKLMEGQLRAYLEEHGQKTLGQPILSEENEMNLDGNDDSFSFKFEVGLAPEFEVKGLDNSIEVTAYKIKATDKQIDEEVTRLRKQFGKRSNPEGEVLENDIVELWVRELEAEDGAVKEKGLESSFTVGVDDKMNADLKAKLLSLKSGEKFNWNIRNIEVDRDEAYIKKYFLQIEEGEDMPEFYECVVDEITRHVPAELDEEFFKLAFGEDGEVADEAAMREKISGQIATYFDSQADGLMFRDFYDRIIELNELDLPDAFLKKWLTAVNEKLTAEQVEKEYDVFAKDLRWKLIRGKIADQKEIQVTEQEVLDALANEVRSYFGGQVSEDMVQSTVQRLLEQQGSNAYEQRAEGILTDKVYKSVKADLNKQEKEVTLEEFNKIIEEINAKLNPPKEEATEEEKTEAAEEVE